MFSNLNLTNLIKRHQLLSFFFLTYVFSWTLWFIFQPFYLGGEVLAAPFIMLGIFGPALVSIALSAIIKSGPKEGNPKAAWLLSPLFWYGFPLRCYFPWIRW